MAIGVEWAAPPLDDAQIASLQAVYEADTDLRSFLPARVPVQAFMFHAENEFGVESTEGKEHLTPENVTPPQFIVTPPQFVIQNGGFDLQRFDSQGKASWIASIRPEVISVSCTAYDRWTNVKPQALAILRPFVEAAITKGAKVSAIGLQYQDAFRLLDGASPAVTEKIFRKNGKHLPMHLFEQPSFWHCHQGWFSKAPDERRVLNNVAIEVAEVNGTHFARIGGQHRIFATSFDGMLPMPIAAGEIDEILQCLHGENIDVINGVLSDGALRAIGCTERGT